MTLSQYKQKKLQQTTANVTMIDTTSFIKNNGDSLTINDGLYNFLNFTYYNKSLFGLEGFQGFTSRSFFPNAELDFGSENVTSILLVLDTANEQKIGLAPHFNPYILAKNEVMLLKSAMDFLILMSVTTSQFILTYLTIRLSLIHRPQTLIPYSKLSIL